MKSQLKSADRSGARVALIVGPDELAAGHGVAATRCGARGPSAPSPGPRWWRQWPEQPGRDTGLALLCPTARDRGRRPKGPPVTVPPSATEATSMRTRLCGTLRRRDVGTTVTRLRLGGQAPRARRAPGLRRPARPHRHRPVRGPRHGRRAQRVRPGRRGRGPAPARGHGQPRPPDRRGGARRLHGHRPQRGRAAAVRRGRPGRGRRGHSGSGTATSTSAGPGCRPTCARGPRSTRALRAAMDRQGFVEVETPLLWAPTPEGAREFAVPSRLQPGSLLRAAPEPPAGQAAARWWPGWTATTRSPAACGTRTCGPTASSSSPSWTSRRPSSPRRTCSASCPRRCSTPPRRSPASGPATSRG